MKQTSRLTTHQLHLSAYSKSVGNQTEAELETKAMHKKLQPFEVQDEYEAS
jgi:hypothetical protein